MDRVLMSRIAALAVAAAFAVTAAQAGDADHGKQLFNAKCGLCHSADQGGPNKLGPNLFAVVGRHSASVANFNYSSAMRGANVTWTSDKLALYLAAPQKTVPGTRMTFAGFSDPAAAADVIAFLATQK